MQSLWLYDKTGTCQVQRNYTTSSVDTDPKLLQGLIYSARNIFNKLSTKPSSLIGDRNSVSSFHTLGGSFYILRSLTGVLIVVSALSYPHGSDEQVLQKTKIKSVLSNIHLIWAEYLQEPPENPNQVDEAIIWKIDECIKSM